MSTLSAECGEATVGEEQRLDDEHHRHAQDPDVGPDQHGREDPAEQVPARAGGHGEVEHLRGEDERRDEPRQRHLPLVEHLARPAQRDPDAGGSQRGGAQRRLGVEEAVGDVHEPTLLRTVCGCVRLAAGRGMMATMAPAHRRDDHDHADSDEHVESILDRLRADGGRVTTGRRAIVRALLTGPDHHVTAEDVAQLAQAEQPDVHLSTVYRTLEALERVGVVDRTTLGGGGAVFHLTDHVHHHLVCDACGGVTEIPEELLASLAAAIDERYRFAVATSALVLSGRCAACR